MTALSACTPLFQKRASDPAIDGCAPQCGHWELNSGPLALLTAESCLQPHHRLILCSDCSYRCNSQEPKTIYLCPLLNKSQVYATVI